MRLYLPTNRESGGITLFHFQLPAILLLLLIIMGCGHVKPSTAEVPAPVASAAQPAAAGPGNTPYAKRGIESIRAALQDYALDEAVSEVPRTGLSLAAANLAARCVAPPGDLALLLCQFGPDASLPVAQALFWHDGWNWQGQLYPQLPAQITADRRERLGRLGCQEGCRGGFLTGRQLGSGDSPELLVVLNLVGVPWGGRAEEVQLLRLAGNVWSVAWAPWDGVWRYTDSHVLLPVTGGASFQVRNSSRGSTDWLSGYFVEGAQSTRWFAEQWSRKGDEFVLQNWREEPGPYGSLVRLVHYLSTGSPAGAEGYLAESVSLDDAQKALAQKPRRQGWRVASAGPGAFVLDPGGNQPKRGVRFEWINDRWVLTHLWYEGHGGNG